MHPIVRNELTLRVFGRDNLEDVRAPLILFSNHSSHLDATLIMCTLPDRWQAKTAVGAARDYFFDVWWRQAFTALVYGAFPIDRARGEGRSTRRASSSRTGGASWCSRRERDRPTATSSGSGTGGSARARDRRRPRADRDRRRVPGDAAGRFWPRSGRPPVTIRYGAPFWPDEGSRTRTCRVG